MSNEYIKTGVIKSLHNKGYGFITNSDTGKDIFFHLSGCVDPAFEDLTVGTKVEYTEVEGIKGIKAIEIVARK